MRSKYIADYSPGEKIEDLFLLKSCQAKTTKTDARYLEIHLQDRTGTLPSKKWDVTEDEIREMTGLPSGALVQVAGVIGEYNGQKDCKITAIRPATDPSRADISDLVKTAPYSSEKMYEILMEKVVDTIQDADFRDLCRTIYDDFKEQILYWPAGQSVHHDCYGGLLWHTYRMARTACKLCEIYPYADRSLLLAGTVLHDIGKIREMDANLYGMVSEYTLEGSLLGHIISGIVLISEYAKKMQLPEEKRILLEHMIAAHHGSNMEHGSAKKPAILEVFLLHELDKIDMYAYVAEEQGKVTSPGTFTGSLLAFDKQKVYIPAYEQEKEE